MAHEAAARGIEGASIDFASEVARRCELQALAGRHGAELVASAVGVVVLAFGDVDDGEGAERLDGHAEAALGELVADLVEHGRQHLLYGGAADAAALDDCADEMGFVFVRTHTLVSSFKFQVLSSLRYESACGRAERRCHRGWSPSLLGRAGVGLLYSQGEVVGLEDAAVAQAAGLTGSCELHEAGTLVGIDGDGDAFFAPDAVAVAGGHIPYAPGDALGYLDELSVES